MSEGERIMRDGTTVPTTMLIGVTRGQWPIQVFYNSEQGAAEWLNTAEKPGQIKHVYRVSLEIVSEMEYVPPVPALLQESAVILASWDGPSEDQS